MTNRVILDSSGLRVSRAGVDVLTAALADIVFRADDKSMPIITRVTAAMPSSWGTVVSLAYGKTFSYIPHSSLLHTPSAISSATYYSIICDAVDCDGFIEGVPAGVNGDIPFLYWKRYYNRVDIWQTHASGGGANLLGGYVTMVLYDYGE
jgi:hypothetical protein